MSMDGNTPVAGGLGDSRVLAYTMLAGMVLVWSFNWIIIKKVVVDIGPMWFTAFRFAGAALVTTLLCSWLKEPWAPADKAERWRLAVVGLFSIAGNLACLSIGLQYADAGRGAVLAYTMQMWAIPLGFVINGDRVNGVKVSCGLIALVGTVLLLDLREIGGQAGFGYFVLTCAAINWAIGSCLYRRFQWSAPFWTQVNVQLCASTVFMLIAAVLFDEFGRITFTPVVAGGLLYNWLLGTGLCYWWWSRVLRMMPAAQGGLVLCAIPLAAIAFSGVVFGERLSQIDLIGTALVIVGIIGALLFDIRLSKSRIRPTIDRTK